MKIDYEKLKAFWQKRALSPYFWISTFSLMVLVSQQFGVDLSTVPFIGNYENIINAFFAFLSALGIAVDTSTPGIGD